MRRAYRHFFGDGAEEGEIAELMFFGEGLKALEVDQASILMKPVDDLVEETRIMTGDGQGEQKQSLRIDYPWNPESGHSQPRPRQTTAARETGAAPLSRRSLKLLNEGFMAEAFQNMRRHYRKPSDGSWVRVQRAAASSSSGVGARS